MSFWTSMMGRLGGNGGAALDVPRVRAEVRSTPYEATSPRPRQASAMSVPDLGPSVVVEGNAEALRKQARHAYRNFADFRAPVDAHVTNLIGTGIKPVPKLKDPAARRALLQKWDEFQERLDTRGLMNFYQLQALVARALVVDGEVFVVLREREEEKDGTDLQLQVLEADYLDLGFNDPQKRIRQGIEFNGVDRPVVYHFWTTHPGEPGHSAERKAFPADRVLHIFKPDRPSQVRGVTRWAPVQVAVQQLAAYQDAYLRRQQIANLPSTFIESPAEDGPFPLDGDGNVIIETGQPVFLRPGQKVSHNAPPAPDASYDAYVRAVRRGICAGVGIPYEVAFADLANVNDRGMRAVLGEYRRSCVADQWLLVRQLCDPIWREFAGEVSARWMPQGWPYFSPTADVNAKAAALASGFTSRAAIVGEMGDDVEDVDLENKADRERERQMGLTYGDGQAAGRKEQ